MNIYRNIFATTIISSLLSIYITYVFCKHNFSPIPEVHAAKSIIPPPVPPPLCDVNTVRLQGYKLIKPLLYSDKKCESNQYGNLKTNMSSLIDGYKKAGVLQSASVYMRVFNKNETFTFNDTETYLPGSLIKVAGLITYLRMEELHPGTLDKKYTYGTPKEVIPNQTFNSKQIERGKTYTVRELLNYMVTYSDNNATYILNKNVDINIFKKIFTDLNITMPDFNTQNYKVTVKDFSVMMRVLYNASYLNDEHSEYALELLGQSDFNEAMVKGLPANTIIAHKFGEMGDATTRQLHETGIIYVNNTAYLLTVMTKGYDVHKLPEVISSISKLAYESVSQETKALAMK